MAMKKMKIRVADELAAEIKAEAHSRGLSMAEVVRQRLLHSERDKPLDAMTGVTGSGRAPKGGTSRGRANG
jgi:hypothetical protein